MRTLSDIFEDAISLGLKGKVADIVDELLQRGLDLEGPPPEPIKGISTDYRRDFIRTTSTTTRPNGTPIGIAATWLTDTWRCLLLEIPSCAMARPHRPHQNNKDASDTNRQGRHTFVAPAMAVLDSKSRRFQLKIVDACRCLNLNQSYKEAAVVCILGTDRTFLAWRERQDGETFNAMLRGDTDNYTKNCLDGLQKARIIINDRGVFRLVATKSLPTTWLTTPTSVSDEITQAAIQMYKQGVSHQEIKNDLIISYAKMAEIFPNYKSTKKIHDKKKNQTGRDPGRPPMKAYTQQDVIRALTIAESEGLRAARRQTGVPTTQIKMALVAKLGIIPKRAGRPTKVIPNFVIEKIRTLAQNGNKVTDIHALLRIEDKDMAGIIVSVRKIRTVLNLHKKPKYNSH